MPSMMDDLRRRILLMTRKEEIQVLVDEYRDRCLWFLDRGYYPATPEETLRVLGHIEQYGDLAAFKRAARIRQWLLQNSNAMSAGS